MDYITPIRAGMPLQGNINNIVIFIRFQGESEFTRTIPYYDALFNSTEEGADSVYNFFHQTSYSQVNVTSTFYSKNWNSVVSYEDVYPRSYYLPYDQATNPNGYTTDTRGTREIELLKNAVLAVRDEIEEAGINLDIDNDGSVDSITFVIHGPTAANYWGTLLAPHNASMESADVKIGGKTVDEYAFMIDDTLFTGLLVHEMLHQMGFEDYYPYTNQDEKPVWTWDTMGVSTVAPANTSAYSKYEYGKWITNIPTIKLSQRVTLIPLSEPAGALMNCCKIETSNPNQYLVLEYRIKTQAGIDSNIPGTGLLIYRVSEEKAGKGNADGKPWELYIFRPGVMFATNQLKMNMSGKYVKNATITSDGNIEEAFLSQQSGRTEAGTSDFPIFFEDGTDMGIRISNVGEAGDTISFDVSFATTPTADIGVTKMADSTSVSPDATINYTVVVSNAGPNTATGVRVIDNVPSQLSNPQYSIDNGTTWRNWTSTYSIGDLANGDSVTILYRGTVKSTAVGNIDNTVIVTATTTDPNPNNNTATVVTPINRAAADISVAKTTTSTSLAPGDQITYSIVVANAGPSNATGVILNDVIPVNLQDVQYSIDDGTTWKNWMGSYSIGALANGASTTILLRGTVRSNTTSSVNNVAQVTSTSIDPDLSNNVSSVITPVIIPEQSADISVTKTADTENVEVGDILTYTIVVSNAGPNTAQGVTLTDLLPTVLINQQYSTNNGGIWRSWESPYLIGNLAMGVSRTILVRGVVSDAATIGQITNTATVSSVTPDQDESNNTDSVTTTIGQEKSADISVTKTASSQSVAPGSRLTYTIVVANAGPSTAQGVTLTDVIPSELTRVQYSTNNGMTWTTWSSPYTIGNLGNGASRTILIRGTVKLTALGQITNTARVSATTPDPNPNNNASTITTTIATIQEARLTVTQKANKIAFYPGQEIVYTIAVTNQGPDIAENVTVIDTIPMGITEKLYSVNNGPWRVWNGIYGIGNLNAGSTVTITIKGIVTGALTGENANIVIVTSTTSDSSQSNTNIARVDFTVLRTRNTLTVNNYCRCCR